MNRYSSLTDLRMRCLISCHVVMTSSQDNEVDESEHEQEALAAKGNILARQL